MDIASTASTCQTQRTSSPQLSRNIPSGRVSGNTSTTFDEAVKEQQGSIPREELNELFALPPSLAQYTPEFATMTKADMTLGAHVVPLSQRASGAQWQAWAEYQDIFREIYSQTLSENGIKGGFDLGDLPQAQQEEFAELLHHNLSKAPNKERIQELMDIMGLDVPRL